jgi:hypothetical protein
VRVYMCVCVCYHGNVVVVSLFFFPGA